MYVRSENVSEVLSLYIQMITLPTGLKISFRVEHYMTGPSQ